MNFVEVSGFANLNIGFGPRPNPNTSQDSALDPKSVSDSDSRPNREDSVNSIRQHLKIVEVAVKKKEKNAN